MVYISATFNNTQITITDPDGRVMCWSSAGAIGFKGSRKGTPYAAQQASLGCRGRGARSARHEERGSPREGARLGPRVRRPRAGCSGLHIVVIRDVTPIPHNGCRPPKRRRV